MGTQRLGSNANGSSSKNIFFDFSGGEVWKAKGNSQTTPSEIYVDQIYVYCGREDSGSSTFKFALYSTGGTLHGQSDINHSYGQGVGWNHGEFSQGNYIHILSGKGIVGAVCNTSSGGIQSDCYNDGGNFDHNDGRNTFPSPWSGTNKVWGNLPWYCMYFPKATVTSIPSTPQFPGASITVNGISFTAGVTAVKLNGVACSSVSVVNDTTLTCTLPSNASTGPIEVDTYAGTAVSSSNLIVSGGRIVVAGVLTSTTSARIVVAGALTPITSIRTVVSGVLTDVH